MILARLSGRDVVQRVLGNTAWLVLDRVLRLGIGMLVTVFVARYLGPARFGVLNYCQALVWMFGIVATLGLETIVIRDLALQKYDRRVVLGSALALRLLAATVCFVAEIVTIVLMRSSDHEAMLLVALLAMAFWPQAFDVVDHHYQAAVRSLPIVVIRNVTFCVFALARLALLLLTDSLLLFALMLSSETIVVAFLLLRRSARDGVSFRLSDGTVLYCKQLVRQSWPLVVAGLSVAVYMRIDQIMLGQLSGDMAAGVLSAAVRISEVWYFVPVAILGSVAPILASTYQESALRYRLQLARVGRVLVWLAIGVAVVMTMLADLVVRWLYGPEYRVAGVVLAIHSWGGVFVCLGLVGSNCLLNLGLLRFSMYQTCIGALVNIALNVFLIPRYGAVGAAVATIFSQSMAAFFAHALSSRTRSIFSLQLSLFLPKGIFAPLPSRTFKVPNTPKPFGHMSEGPIRGSPMPRSSLVPARTSSKPRHDMSSFSTRGRFP